MIIRKTAEARPDTEIPGVSLKTLIGEEQGAPRFSMRVFDVAPGASTPFHNHWWEHEVYILSGEGVVRSVSGDTPLQAEDAILVAGDEQHCFVNTGSTSLKFICCIPVASAQPPAPGFDAPVCDPVMLPVQ